MGQMKQEPEEVVAKPRQMDVLHSQGRPVAQAIQTISVTPFTYDRWSKEFGELTLDQVSGWRTWRKKTSAFAKPCRA